MSAFIETANLLLRGLEPRDATEEYLSWLNDPEVLKYRGPKAFPLTMNDVNQYLETQKDRGDLLLGIFIRNEGKHIGNITLNFINWVHGSAELAIMIGARDVWGKGFGKEALAAVTSHAFLNMGLHRLGACSPNPGFNTVVKFLSWVHEGTKRKAFLLDGEYVDMESWGILKEEFTGVQKEYEKIMQTGKIYD